MDYKISGPAHVDIQGDKVLRFVKVNNKFAKYELVGFEDKSVTILDYRDFGIAAMGSLLATNDLQTFAPQFNRPANLTITRTNQGKYQIELRKTSVENPGFMLWIAIGIKEKIIPAYDFWVKEVLPYKKKVALLSLYQRPYPEEYPLNYSP